MPFKDYSLKDRVLGNIIISFVFALLSILGLILLSFVFPITIIPTTYFLFPSYFILISVFVELRIRKEKRNVEKIN